MVKPPTSGMNPGVTGGGGFTSECRVACRGRFVGLTSTHAYPTQAAAALTMLLLDGKKAIATDAASHAGKLGAALQLGFTAVEAQVVVGEIPTRLRRRCSSGLGDCPRRRQHADARRGPAIRRIQR